MSLMTQIAKASFVLLVTAIIHIAVLFEGAKLLGQLDWIHIGETWVLPAMLSCLIVLLAHTVNVWIWAVVRFWMRALDSLEAAIYFSLVTTTTLGYGDIVLKHKWRVFGAMAAISGLLTFGLSTTFLITTVQMLFTDRLG
jgi:hypothetical protein